MRINTTAKSLKVLLFEISQMSHLHYIKSHSQIDRMLVKPACGSVLKIYFKPEAFEISKKLIIFNVYGCIIATIELFETWKNSLK